MNRVVKILMKRDGLSQKEAEKRFDEVQNIINEYLEDSADSDEIEQVIMDELGLEPDYIEDFIYA